VKQLLLKLERKKFIMFRPDEKDKRKQRIHLTDHCMEFCEKNDEMSIDIMKNMFSGIPEKDIKTTIRTIMGIEKNLRDLTEEGVTK
jgi:DNA-binding MarR family transcriptional regulator